MSPDERIAAIAQHQHGVLSIDQARAEGFKRSAIQHRLRTGRWLRLSKGVYAISGSPSTRERRVLVAVLSFGSRAVAASATAAWLLGVIDAPGELVHVLVPKGAHCRNRKGIIVAEACLTKTDVRVVKGIP